jgi:crossover junction endodeoxyribonuclease RuvC
MRVLGIDPGLERTGYGILEANGVGLLVLEAGVVRSRPDDPMAVRLMELAREMGEIIGQFNPDAIAIEELYSHYKHPRTAIIMGHARGILILKAAEAGIPVISYAATRIKKSLTGNGRANKLQMQKMIASTLGLPHTPESPDAADALAVALCHCRAKAHHVVEVLS